MGIFVGGMRAIALIVPITGTGLLAITGNAPDSYPNPEFGPILGKKVEAYITPVLETQRTVMSLKTEPPAEMIEESADIWLREYKQGHLMPLPSVRSSDTTREGVKGQILTARNVIIGHLIRLGDEARRSGNSELSKSRYTKALDMSQIARDSDLNALATSLSFENATWVRLSKLGVPPAPNDPIDEARLARLMKREFIHILRQPGVTTRDRKRMQGIFQTAKTNEHSLAEWLSTSDYELSLMLAAARRIESLLENRDELYRSVNRVSIEAESAHS